MEETKNRQDIAEKVLNQNNKKISLILSVSALALMLLLGVTSSLPFKDQIFNQLYPKPSSQASFQTDFMCGACRADIDKNKIVGAADYMTLSACLGRSASENDTLGNSCQSADINGNNIIEESDFDCLKSQFRQTCDN